MNGIVSIKLHQCLTKYYQYNVKALKNGTFYEWNTEPMPDVVDAHEAMMTEVDQFLKEE